MQLDVIKAYFSLSGASKNTKNYLARPKRQFIYSWDTVQLNLVKYI